MRQRDLEKTLTEQINDAQANITRGLDAVNKEQTKLDSYRAVFNALQALLDRVRGAKKPKAAKTPKPPKPAAGAAVQQGASPERPL